MAQIGRSLDELSSKIKQVGADIKAADKDVRTLDKSLKLNPGNVDAVRQKYGALSQSLQLNTQRIALYKQKQDELNRGLKDGSITQKDYEKELVKVNKALASTEANVNELTAALQKKNAAIRDAKYTNLINGLEKAEKQAQKFSKAALAVVGALTAIVASAIKTGDELSDTAAKYNTTAEKLQIQANRFNLLASNADGYTAALVKVGNIQKSILSGGGGAYLTYLERLGLTQTDLENKTNAEVYDLIFAGLQNVTDATDRAIIAQGLFGDAGLDVALVAGATNAELTALDETLIANGIITNEQAAAADEAANKFAALKQQFQANAMEVMVALMPAIEALTEFLKTSVIPILSGIAKWLEAIGPGGQKILLIILFLIIVLPKLIAVVKGVVTVVKLMQAATLGQAAATTALTAASTPWLPIIMAIAMALLLVISLINMFIGKSKSAVDLSSDLLGQLDATESQLNGMGYGLDYSAEQTYNSNTKRELDVNVNVNAQGDGTEVDEENAEKIAGYIYDQISIDLINQALGAVAR